MINKHKKGFMTPNYIEHFLILVSVVTGCISISDFDLLVGIPTGITSSVIEKYKSIIKKRRKLWENSIVRKNRFK